jgi:hypothetical protein
MDFGSLNNIFNKKKHGRHRRKFGLSGRWIEVVVSCGSGISEPIGLVYLAIMGGTGTILIRAGDGCWKPQKQKHGRHRHKLGLSVRWIEVVVLVAAVYLSPLALCTSWKPSWEAPAQSSIEGKMDLEASKTKTHGRHRHKFGLCGRWIEVVVLVAAVYLSPLDVCTSWKPSWEAPAQSWIEGRMDSGSLKKNNMGGTGTKLD